MTLKVFGLAIIAIAHITIWLAMYKARITKISPLFDSDFLLFAVPAIAAFAAYLSILVFSGYTELAPSKIGILFVLAFILSVLSGAVALAIGANLWGT